MHNHYKFKYTRNVVNKQAIIIKQYGKKDRGMCQKYNQYRHVSFT